MQFTQNKNIVRFCDVKRISQIFITFGYCRDIPKG